MQFSSVSFLVLGLEFFSTLNFAVAIRPPPPHQTYCCTAEGTHCFTKGLPPILTFCEVSIIKSYGLFIYSKRY